MRRAIFWLGMLVVLMGALLAVAAVERREITSVLLRYALARAGFPDARFDVEKVELDGISIVGVDAGLGLRTDRVDVALDFHRLPALPVERVRITGARMDLTHLARPQAADGAEPAPGDAVPFGLLPALELEAATVIVPTMAGAVSLHLDSKVESDPTSLRMRLQGDVNGGAGSAIVHADADRAPDGTVGMNLSLSSLHVRHPRLAVADGKATVRLKGQAVGLDLLGARGQVRLSLAGVVAGGGTTIGAVEATLPLTVERRSAGWSASLANARMQLSERGLDASGVSGEVTGGAAALSIKRLIDTRGGRFQPLAVTLRVRPAQADLHVDVGLIAASGGGEARARGIYRPAQRTLDVAVEVPSADLSGVHIEGVDGRVELARLSPPSTQGTQTLRIRRIDRGVALTDVVLDWGLEAREGGEGSRLRIDRLVTQFASGRVLVEDATLDPLAEENRLTFRVEELDLARLFEIVALEGVSATGRVSGTIPVVVRKGAAAVEGASLAAANGLLRIRSESAARMLASGGQSVELLLDALRDFHYDGLRMAIDKQFEGESTVRMTLEGSNPAVLQGHPFRINLNLTGNVDRLLAAFLEIARISDRAVRATVHALE